MTSSADHRELPHHPSTNPVTHAPQNRPYIVRRMFVGSGKRDGPGCVRPADLFSLLSFFNSMAYDCVGGFGVVGVKGVTARPGRLKDMGTEVRR